MNILIKFKQNDSPKFEEILTNSKKLNNFSQTDQEYSILIEDNEINNRKNLLRGIINRIKDWDKTEFFIDNKMVSSFELLQALNIKDCEKEHKKISNNGQYCLNGEGWGCSQLNGIYYKSADNNIYSMKNWYDYGRFDKGDWLIDKEKIKAVLKDEAQRKHIDECHFYSDQGIDKVLNTLPSRINPNHDPNWEYRYKSSSNGELNQEIIGVQPRKNTFSENPFSDLGNIFSSSSPLSGIFNALNNLDPDSFGNGSFSENNSDSSGDFFSDLFGGLSGGESNIKSKSGRSIPNTTFNDIGGLDSIIRQVKEVIELPIVAPELLSYYNIKPHKGILLYGPPGCGKTLLAKAVANEINAHFISISGPEILNKYLGQSEENLRSIFTEAAKKAPSIIYFDEFDSLAANRNQELDPYNSRVVNQILTLLDGMDDNSKICVIASTNRIDMIDEAIKRPGRFDYVLEVTKPTLDGCKQIFNIYTQNMPIEESFDKEQFVNDYLFGSTGAEIAFVATEAAYNSIRRTVDIDSVLSGNHVNLNNTNKIIESDFLKAVEALRENRKNNNR